MPSAVEIGSIGDQTSILTTEGQYYPAKILEGKVATIAPVKTTKKKMNVV